MVDDGEVTVINIFGDQTVNTAVVFCPTQHPHFDWMDRPSVNIAYLHPRDDIGASLMLSDPDSVQSRLMAQRRQQGILIKPDGDIIVPENLTDLARMFGERAAGRIPDEGVPITHPRMLANVRRHAEQVCFGAN